MFSLVNTSSVSALSFLPLARTLLYLLCVSKFALFFLSFLMPSPPLSSSFSISSLRRCPLSGLAAASRPTNSRSSSSSSRSSSHGAPAGPGRGRCQLPRGRACRGHGLPAALVGKEEEEEEEDEGLAASRRGSHFTIVLAFINNLCISSRVVLCSNFFVRLLVCYSSAAPLCHFSSSFLLVLGA